MYEHVYNNSGKNKCKTGKDFNNKNKKEYFCRYGIKVIIWRGRIY